MNGWIKLHRSMLDWEWYRDVNVTKLFIHMLLMASTEDKRWQGVEVKRGDLIASRETLAAGTGLTVQQVRTALNKLRSTGEVTVNQHPKFGVYSIKNYNLYQDINQQSNRQITDDQPAINRQSTTSKEDKNTRKEKLRRESVFTPPTLTELEDYCDEIGIALDCERFLNYYQANGWRVGSSPMRDWRATARNWARKDAEREAERLKPQAKPTKFSNFEQRVESLPDGPSKDMLMKMRMAAEEGY